MAATYNIEYRDQVSESKYPFDPQATQAVFPTQLFLDASLYVSSVDYEPPFYIRGVQPAEDDKVRVLVADKRGAIAGKAVCDPSESSGTAVLYTDFGRSAGVLVFDPDRMADLRGELHDGPRAFTEAQTRLASEVVRFYEPSGVLNVDVNGVSVTNVVRVVFSGGVTYDPADNSINLYGEEGSLDKGLLTINDAAGEHAFLLAHVHQDYESESALRIETSGSFLRIGKSRDFV